MATSSSIPYYIVRIWPSSEKRELRRAELKGLLLARNYHESLIDSSIENLRKVALLKV